MRKRSAPPQPHHSQRISEFLRLGDGILQRRAVRSGLKSSFTLNWAQDAGLTIDSEQPDLEDYRSFWLDLRQLLLQRSVTHFESVMKAARAEFGNAGPESYFDSCREAWVRALRQSPIGFSLNGTDWAPKDLINLWLNGEVFHGDQDKRALWLSVEQPFPAIPHTIIHNTVISLLEIMMAAMARIDFLLGGPGVVSVVEGRSSTLR